MQVKFKIGKRIRNLSGEFESKLSGDVQKTFSAALEEILGDIVERTLGGKDYRGRAFKDYSESYLAFKNGQDTSKKRANRARGKASRGSIVNLKYTGKMLQALRQKVQKAKGKLVGTLFVLPTEADKAKKNQKTRPFFGLSDKQIKQLRDVIKEAILK